MNAAVGATLVEALGWALLHVVWQGACIAAALACLLRLAHRATPSARYLAACGALLRMVVAFAATFAWQFEISWGHAPAAIRLAHIAAALAHVDVEAASRPVRVEPDGSPEPGMVGAAPNSRMAAAADVSVQDLGAWTDRLRPWLPAMVGLWGAGVGLLSLRLLFSWRTVCQLRDAGREIDDAMWRDRFARLRQTLGLRRPVRLLASARATVPCVVGWLKPAVLVPAAMLSGMPWDQLEAILAHELAHVRRHDYLVNLLQNVVETLLFYHPAVWWISGQIRKEREHCCDDVAAATCGGVLDYARALMAIEQLRQPAADLRVAASGGSLVERIRRLVGASGSPPSASPASDARWPLAAMVLFLGAAVAVVAAGRASLGEPPDAQPPPAAAEISSSEKTDTAKVTPAKEPAAAKEPGFIRVYDSWFFDKERAAGWFHAGEQIHFVLYHRGFLQHGLEYTEYGDHTWRFRGKIYILKTREFSVLYESKDPQRLFLDDKPFDLTQGRVIVLNAKGDPLQLDIDPPAAKKENLVQLGRDVAAALEAQAKGADTAKGPTAPKPPAKSIEVRGKVVDDETGLPVAPIITQAGKFDPADPMKITWGYTEGRSDRKDGSFSASVNWADGWTARILADGYLPQPLFSQAPPADKDAIEVVVRLKRGRLVRGQVFDHEGQPVAGAAVFAVGPTGLNLAGGEAIGGPGENNGQDSAAKPAHTDAAGRFELPAGAAKTLAVSCAVIDAWPAPVAEEGETVIRLPKPAKIEVSYSIEGADADGKIFYQLLAHDMPGWDRLESTRDLPIKNGGRLELAAMAPGKYQLCRKRSYRFGNFGTGTMLERQFVELKPGETKQVRYERPQGATVRGKITWPEGSAPEGVVVSIKSQQTEKDPFNGFEWRTTYDARLAAKDGSFTTERIAPGRHLLVAEGYAPQTAEQRMSTGIRGPSLRAQTAIDVPAEGEVMVPDLPLAPATWDPPQGLEFLRTVPELRGVSLQMSEKEFLDLVKPRGVNLQSHPSGDQTTYDVSTDSGEQVNVSFRDGVCSGIQRMRPSRGVH